MMLCRCQVDLWLRTPAVFQLAVYVKPTPVNIRCSRAALQLMLFVANRFPRGA